MKFRRQATEEDSVNLTPLIDVVFLLLIFFMVSTTFTKETRLGIELPEASGQAPATPVETVEVSISSQGEYTVNGQALTSHDKASLLRVLKGLSFTVDSPFIISADANARHQSVVTVMDVAGEVGFSNLSIITREPSE